MALTIDELNIKITADCKSANRALTSLIKRLEKLKDALNGASGLNVNISNSFNRVTNQTNNTTKSTTKFRDIIKKTSQTTLKFTDTLARNIAKWRTLFGVVNTAARIFGDWFNESNDYIETLNLFRVTMGDASDAAYAYAENVQQLVGIDIRDWMQYQGVFKNLTSGFGVAGDAANTMSQNLTQLSYDMASFFNTDVETAFDKLSSAMSGQVKGLREFGIDTTVASLQEYALAKGITTKVRAMSQAEKSLLRYNYILEKSIHIQGDMARTLVTPANAMRILSGQITQMKRALGDVISVLVARFIPYVQAAVMVITDAAKALARLWGFTLPTIDYSGLNTGGYVDDLEEGEEVLEETSDTLNKIKKQLMGFDELNILGSPDASSSGGSDTAVGGGLNGMEPLEYDFLEGLVANSNLNQLKQKLKEILAIVGEIALGFAAWKVTKLIFNHLPELLTTLGLVLVIDAIRCVLKDGLDIGDILKGSLGAALLGAGIGFKLGGLPGALGGAIIAIGLSLVIMGVTSMFDEGVDFGNIATTIIGALITAAGIFTTIKLFNKKTSGAGPETTTATETAGELAKGTKSLTGALKKLATNLAWGLLIVVEVAAAALIFAGAVAILGWELEQVGKTWEPVIANGSVIAIALGVGAGILAIVGAACAGLGYLGSQTAIDIAWGTLALLEIGVATAIFLAEIWAIGWGLEEIGIAWQPVLDNGKTIAIGIGIGTGLLVGIGVVTAALGSATVAGAGALPIAIAIGTAVLMELGAAFMLFVGELILIAKQLTNDLHPALKKLNEKLPDLTSSMTNFTSYMKTFAGEVVSYTKSAAISGFAATVDSIVKFFTKDPIKALAKDANKQYDQAKDLNTALTKANPELETCIDLMNTYYTFLGKIETLTKQSNNISLASGMFVSMKEVGKNLVLGFVDGMKSENKKLADGVKDVLAGALTDKTAKDYGKDFGTKLSTAIKDAISIGKVFSTISISLSASFSQWVSSDKKKIYEALGLSGWPTLHWYAYASGGFPTVGEMFIAREAGPELVGSIGKKTAVANNDQIISGIEAGVYRAMVAANSGKGGGNQTIRIINEIDGDVVGEKVIQYHNGRVLQTGVSPLLV